MLLNSATQALAGADSSAAPLVAEAGRLEAIQFQGNSSFDRERLLSALKFDFDVQTAAHPLAPLSNYLAVLEDKILAGYHREGFPEATVDSGLETNGTSIRVRVGEGPRYYCGEVRVRGGGLETNATLLRSITASLWDLRSDEWEPVFWQKSDPAPFDPAAQETLRHRVEGALTDLGYYQPRFKCKVVPVQQKGVADLELEFDSAGTAAVLEEIQINELFRNSRQQVLDFLKLKSGMPIQPGVANEVAEKLRKSGRFFKHEVQLSPLSQVGHFKLVLKLDEMELAPPLDQPLAPAEDALLKFGERLTHWDSQPEDWVIVLSLPLQHSVVQAELVLSSAGVAGALRTGVSNRPVTVKAACIVAGRRVALFSPGGHRKLIWEPERGYVPGGVRLIPPNEPFTGPAQEFQFSLNPNFTRRSPKLLNLEFEAAPVSFLCAAHYYDCTIEQQQVKVEEHEGSEPSRLTLKLDARSGRLLSADARLPRGSMHFTTEEGGFARLVNEITAASVACSNVLDSSQGAGSLLSFAGGLSDAASPVLEPKVLRDLDDLLGSQAPKSTWSQLRAQTAPAVAALGRLRLLLGGLSPAELLQPLNNFWTTISSGQGEDSFHIPRGRSATRTPTQEGMAPFAAIALADADQLFARSSWAWTAFRETILALEGAGAYTADSLQRLRQSEDIGPAGCAAVAAILSKASTPEARLFARKGLSLLTAEDFRRDYECLLQTNTVIGDTLQNILSLFQTLTPEQAAALSPDPASPGGLFLRDLAQALRSGFGPAAKSAWPAFEGHWTNVVRPVLETALNARLPKVNSLTNSRALIARAEELRTSPIRTEQMRDEIIDCWTKAAEMGDAEAQYCLGFYYDREKHDTTTALVWLEKAARQEYPHTGCRLGDIYSQGQNVPRDLDRAVEWYRLEAAHECVHAQYCLGRTLLDRREKAEGLSWYRRAAEGGFFQAMSALGEYYSDDIFSTPDYVEAYVWLRLVASRGDLPAAVSLRRVRKKMSPEQVVEACKRGASLSNLIHANVKKDEAREKKKQGCMGHLHNQSARGQGWRGCCMAGCKSAGRPNRCQPPFRAIQCSDGLFSLCAPRVGDPHRRLGDLRCKSLRSAPISRREEKKWQCFGTATGSANTIKSRVRQCSVSTASTWPTRRNKAPIMWPFWMAKLGQYELAVMYYEGLGVEKNREEAFKWVSKAADQGLAAAQARLALLYSHGDGVERNVAEAVSLWRKAAEQDEPMALTRLGALYRTGDGVEKDPLDAVRCFRRAAEQGFAPAQTYLGWMYEAGEGVKRDYSEALKFLRQAADQNLAMAQVTIG